MTIRIARWKQKPLSHFGLAEGGQDFTTNSWSKLLGSESQRMFRKRALGLRYRVRYSDSPGGPSDLLRREGPRSRAPLRSSDCNRHTHMTYEPCTAHIPTVPQPRVHTSASICFVQFYKVDVKEINSLCVVMLD